LINHDIAHDTVKKKTPLPRLSLFWKVRGNATALRCPCLPLSVVSCLATLPANRGVTKGGTIPRAPNHSGGSWKITIMSQVLTQVHTSGSNMGAPNLLLAPAPFNLVTPGGVIDGGEPPTRQAKCKNCAPFSWHFIIQYLRFSGWFRLLNSYGQPEVHYHFLTFFRVLANAPLQRSFAPPGSNL